MAKIIVKRQKNADSRTCDWSSVTKKELLKSSKQHKREVKKGMYFLSDLIRKRGEEHDYTKIKNFDAFFDNFKTGFKKQDWWVLHQREERHHFGDEKYIQDDVDLIDILEQITDGVMAGLARTGKYRDETVSPELLLKAYKNTVKLLLSEVEVRG